MLQAKEAKHFFFLFFFFNARAGCGSKPLIPTLGSQRQVELYEFEASLIYIESSKTARLCKGTLSPCDPVCCILHLVLWCLFLFPPKLPLPLLPSPVFLQTGNKEANKHNVWGMEKWLSGLVHMLFLQRT